MHMMLANMLGLDLTAVTACVMSLRSSPLGTGRGFAASERSICGATVPPPGSWTEPIGLRAVLLACSIGCRGLPRCLGASAAPAGRPAPAAAAAVASGGGGPTTRKSRCLSKTALRNDCTAATALLRQLDTVHGGEGAPAGHARTLQ